MKKILASLLIIAILAGTLLSVVSCGGGTSTPKPGIIDGYVNWIDTTASAGRRPLSGMIVDAWDANDQKVGSAVTSSDGRFTIPNVSPGTYTVTANAPADFDQSVEKRWLVSGVKVISEQVAQVGMNYQNSVGDKLPEKYLPK